VKQYWIFFKMNIAQHNDAEKTIYGIRLVEADELMNNFKSADYGRYENIQINGASPMKINTEHWLVNPKKIDILLPGSG